jgi:DNA-directed RNA polymerase subunit RPC12/RpoP
MKCPQCGQESYAIYEINFTNPESGEKDVVTGYRCGNCGHEFEFVMQTAAPGEKVDHG